MPSYPIVEIFHSVQGEAFHTGVPHVFIRFGNCNLRCEWCDTDFLSFEEMTQKDIVEQVLEYDCKRVIFTGGEPAMQDLESISTELKLHGIHLSIETNGTIPIPEIIDLICLLLLIGAMGKSAQFLLHTWLPDAMEGPTPVSALIHAATMVTAGVFLIVRCSPIYEYSPLALTVITIIGMTTAFFAATVALVQLSLIHI